MSLTPASSAKPGPYPCFNMALWEFFDQMWFFPPPPENAESSKPKLFMETCRFQYKWHQESFPGRAGISGPNKRGQDYQRADSQAAGHSPEGGEPEIQVSALNQADQGLVPGPPSIPQAALNSWLVGACSLFFFRKKLKF